MQVRYLTYNSETKKTSGWFETDSEDLKKLMKYNKEFEFVDVMIDKWQEYWRWSRLKGWRKIN